jgi:hypothetical protein
MASQHTQHIQKALDQMNLQIHHVLSEITGWSGIRILDAILAGDRDPVALAELCNWRVRTSRDIVAKALEGDYRPEHVFTLRQSLEGYRYYQKLIAEVDEELNRYLRDLPNAVEAGEGPYCSTHPGSCRNIGIRSSSGGNAIAVYSPGGTVSITNSPCSLLSAIPDRNGFPGRAGCERRTTLAAIVGGCTRNRQEHSEKHSPVIALPELRRYGRR